MAATRGSVLRYTALWLAAAVLVVGGVLLVFGQAEKTVGVPPVLETELSDAAIQSHCELRTARVGEQLNPAVDGPAGGRAAAPGFYDHPLATAGLTAAVRRGIVVIQFRDGLDGEYVDALKTLQAAAPAGTIVVPNATGMRFELTVSAYRRHLGCRHFTRRALDAVQLFRGRFMGSGPES